MLGYGEMEADLIWRPIKRAAKMELTTDHCQVDCQEVHSSCNLWACSHEKLDLFIAEKILKQSHVTIPEAEFPLSYFTLT